MRISKRNLVVERAKELLKNLMDDVLPDSQELSDEVAQSVRVMEIQEYGRERLSAGPTIDESDEILVVEGRADVLNLLKHGIKNAICINGTSVPETIKELSRKKIITVFVDGDRGGDLIIKEMLNVAEIDFVCKAPDGKEVEEITKKEIHKAMRSKISAEQIKLDLSDAPQKQHGHGRPYQKPQQDNRQQQDRNQDNKKQQRPQQGQRPPQRESRERPQQQERKKPISPEEKKKFETMLEDLIGTRGAYILDEKLAILGKVPFTELSSTLKSLNGGVHAIIFDGEVDKDLVATAEKINVKFLVGMESKVNPNTTRTTILTAGNF